MNENLGGASRADPGGFVAPAVALGLIGAALAALVVVHTPWEPLAAPPGGRVPVDVGRDFTAAQIARETTYHHQLWPAVLGGLGATLVMALVLGLTPAGARMVRGVARPFGGGRWATLIAGTVLVTAVTRSVGLPFDIWRERLQRDQGIVVEGWGAYATDLAIAYAFELAATLLALTVFALMVRRIRRWWAPGAAVAAILVGLTSFVYPLVVEPAFHDFRPMPSGELRDSLLALAAADHVHVRDVLVADESKRSTQVNAYVSGLGSSRRIVVFDTTLRALSPVEVRQVVAHELGHVKRSDVAYGTAEGALGAAAGVCVLFLLLRRPWLCRRAGVSAASDPRSLALVLALVALLGAVTSPVTLLISRRVEERADIHSLDLTHDPAALIAMQRLIAINNVADLDPPRVAVALLGDHPTGPQRIAAARTWARLHGLPDPVVPAAGS